jgi:hypothetical protein
MTITVQTFLFVFSEIRWEVIVCFVDIGGTDDYHCLNFLVCVQWVVINSTNINKSNNHLSSYLTEHKRESLDSNGHQIHQYQQSKRWEVIVCFVDIGGIDDHHCLNFFFVFSELRWEVIVCFAEHQKESFHSKWSSIPSISTKQTITSYHNSLNTKNRWLFVLLILVELMTITV